MAEITKPSTSIASLTPLEYGNLGNSLKIPVSTGSNTAAALTIGVLADTILDRIRGREYEAVTLNLVCESDLVLDESILVYLGNSVTPRSYSIDSRTIEFSVPTDVKYKVVFPDVTGYTRPADIVKVASLESRELTGEWTAIGAGGSTEVITGTLQVKVRESTGTNYIGTPVTGATVSCSIGGADPVTALTGDTGVAEFNVPIGSTYTVSVPTPTGAFAYIGTEKTGTMSRSKEILILSYIVAPSDIVAVTADGLSEYTYAQVTTGAVADLGTLKYLVFKNQALVTGNGVFGIDITGASVGYTQSAVWSNGYTIFTSVPSTSSEYYYDGATASNLIREEGDTRSVETPAFDKVSEYTVTVGGVTKVGFLGAPGQWGIIRSNWISIKSFLGAILGSTDSIEYIQTTQFWTSFQHGNDYQSCTSSGQGDSSISKTGSAPIFPFYSF